MRREESLLGEKHEEPPLRWGFFLKRGRDAQASDSVAGGGSGRGGPPPLLRGRGQPGGVNVLRRRLDGQGAIAMQETMPLSPHVGRSPTERRRLTCMLLGKRRETCDLSMYREDKVCSSDDMCLCTYEGCNSSQVLFGESPNQNKGFFFECEKVG